MYGLKYQVKMILDNPYYSTIEDARQTKTDYDHFPYTRWYRGNPALSVPVVAERQAGWRIKNNKCYEQNQTDSSVLYSDNQKALYNCKKNDDILLLF